MVTEEQREHPCVQCTKIESEFHREMMVLSVLVSQFKKKDLDKYYMATDKIKEFSTELLWELGIR